MFSKPSASTDSPSWVPTFLIKRGIPVVNSLEYTFLIAIAAPFGPLVAYKLADKFERKWQIVLAALAERCSACSSHK